MTSGNKGKVGLNQIHNRDGISGMDEIEDHSIDLLITDPPYGISRHLNCKGKRLGSTAKLDFDFGEWDEDAKDAEFSKWVDKALSKVRGWAIIFCAKQDIGNYWSYFEAHDFKAIDALVWRKPDPLPLNGKTKMLNAWEAAIIGKQNGAFFGGYCTHNIFMYQAPKGKSRIHPTQKPLGLFRELIELTTKKGDVILDPFAGSGTTAVACKQLGRNYMCFEIDEAYCKAARNAVDVENSKTRLHAYTHTAELKC